MAASTVALRRGPLLALVGMVFGIYMAASGDHTAAPAHAHLNLLGFVGTLVMGLVYRLDAGIDSGMLAKIQIWLWIICAIVMFPSLVMLLWGNPAYEIGTKITSIGAVISMVIFAYNAFRISASR